MIFSEQDRQVYTCAATGRKYDPLAVKRGLVGASAGRFNEALAEYRDADPVKKAAGEEKLVRYARAALSLKPIDPVSGEGWLDAQALEALTMFTRWLSGKGERARGGQSDAPCAACP